MTALSSDARIGRALKLRALYTVDAECIGDASTDFSPPFDPSLGNCFIQAARWRRAQHIAGRPSAFFDFMEAFDTCACHWDSPMCATHRDAVRRRRDYSMSKDAANVPYQEYLSRMIGLP